MTDDQSLPFAPSTSGASGRPGDNPPSRPCAGSPVKVLVRYRSGHCQHSTWSDERVEELKRLHAEGLPYSRIAEKIGGTRHAVIAKVHRLGLPLRGQNRSDRPHKVREPRVRVRKPILPAPPLALVPIMVEAPTPEPDDCVGTCTLFELTDSMCHWVTDGKIDGLAAYCAVECQSLEELSVGPYCPKHLAMMYKPSAWHGAW